jgi:hypothetical protein
VGLAKLERNWLPSRHGEQLEGHDFSLNFRASAASVLGQQGRPGRSNSDIMISNSDTLEVNGRRTAQSETPSPTGTVPVGDRDSKSDSGSPTRRLRV